MEVKEEKQGGEASWLDKPLYTNVKSQNGQNPIPKGAWEKCVQCQQQVLVTNLIANNFVCTNCDYHMLMPWDKRIELLADNGTFKELFNHIKSADPLNFKSGSEPYKAKLKTLQKRLGINEGIITGTAQLDKIKIALAVMEFRFIGGSMGSAIGERIYQTMLLAAQKKIPFIIVSSSGGARMQEGLLSLMQMAKTCAGVEILNQARVPFISVLTNPTMGGVTASFASLGDVIISEPNAMIGFAGRRVIQQTVHQELPTTFQTAEFLKDHGFVDLITPRHDLKTTLARILRLLGT